MELNDLPDELLLQIFLSLPFNSLIDVFSMALICKKWRRILWSTKFLQRIGSFQYQSRFLINNITKQTSLYQFLQYDPDSSTSFLTVNGDLICLKQDIQNCPLTNTTISMWCRTVDHLSLNESTILLLWHYHLGYLGFYRDSPSQGNALVKCTYTQQHRLKTTFHLELNHWYHIAIVIKEKKNLQLYINGNRIDDWPLESNLNKQNLSLAPYSAIWFASHCGPFKWHGSLFDVCLWNRCLESYEIKQIAQIRTTIEEINFLPDLNF